MEHLQHSEVEREIVSAILNARRYISATPLALEEFMKKSFLAALALLLIAPASMAADAAAASSGIKRTVLSRSDVPDSNYEVVMVLVEVPANTRVGKHTHPGSVVGYVLEGSYTIVIDGQPPRSIKQTDALEVPSNAVHDEFTGNSPAKFIAVFTVEKGKPLATPVSP